MRKFIALILFVISCLIIVNIAFIKSTIEHVEITVLDKERINKDSDSKYLVYTDLEPLENTDAMLFLKFNSADLQGQLQVGYTYEVTIVGWRIPFISMFRNIISIDSIVTDEK